MFATIHVGTVISMESVSMCWIVDGDSIKTSKTAEDKASNLDVEVSSQEIANVSSKDTVTNKKIKSQKEEEEEELQESINRSARTLIDINFKIKKGMQLMYHLK